MQPTSVTGVRIIPIYEGRCLFQLRDDKPDITHPNKWSFVSGAIEKGESFEEAMRRECIEEIGIEPSVLKYLGRSELSACFYTYLSKSEVDSLILGEGQEIRFFDPESMSDLKMTPKLEELVTVYKDKLYKLMQGMAVHAKDFGLIQ